MSPPAPASCPSTSPPTARAHANCCTRSTSAHEALLFRGPGREDHDINEDIRPGEDAFTYVQRVARAKAEGGIQRLHWRGLPPQLLLAADTTLELDGEIIVKPSSPTHAMEREK